MSSEVVPRERRVGAALVAVLLLAWVNLLTTTRWSTEPGALNGWRRPWYTLALLILSGAALHALWRWWRGRPDADRERREAGPAAVAATLIGGAAFLAAAYLSTFPLSSWGRVPFYDDWPGIMQLTDLGVWLLRHGALAGWNWDFLGGYHTSSDLSQSLALTAFLPVTFLGTVRGFQCLIVLYTALVPLAVWLDLRQQGDHRLTWVATGVASILTAGYFGTIMRSGMANSVGGVAFAGLALASSHAARRQRPWGGPGLVASLILVLYTHAAFFAYIAVLLGVEALYYRCWRSALRSGFALAIAFVAALPLHWEMLRYPAYFVPNNLYWDAAPGFDWMAFLRHVYYAAEILALPWRWFNDYVGVAHIWLPAVVVVASWQRTRSRQAFYAWATLAVVLMLRLNTPQLGIVLARELYLYPLVLAPALAGFLLSLPSVRLTLPAAVVVLVLFVAVPFVPVPAVDNIEAFDAELVRAIRRAPGGIVLIENNPHWNMIATPGVRSERSRFDVHFEALLPAATGKRFFGQPQDGYHRSTFRGHVVAGGAYLGRAIDETPPAAFSADLEKWGVARLFVWSDPTRRYLASSGQFVPIGRSGHWASFDVREADVREVVVPRGTGTMLDHDPLGATIELTGVTAGDLVVVRTNYFPAWTATADNRPVALFPHEGQLAFRAPVSGHLYVRLAYARRRPLVLGAWFVALLGAVALGLGTRRLTPLPS